MNSQLDKEVMDIESETLLNIALNHNEPVIKEYKIWDWSDNFMANLVNTLRKDGFNVELENKRMIKVTRRAK